MRNAHGGTRGCALRYARAQGAHKVRPLTRSLRGGTSSPHTPPRATHAMFCARQYKKRVFASTRLRFLRVRFTEANTRTINKIRFLSKNKNVFVVVKRARKVVPSELCAMPIRSLRVSAKRAKGTRGCALRYARAQGAHKVRPLTRGLRGGTSSPHTPPRATHAMFCARQYKKRVFASTRLRFLRVRFTETTTRTINKIRFLSTK